MGTGGPNPAAGAGIALASVIKTFCGERHVSKLVEGAAFGKYNERFDKTRQFDWLSKDRQVQDEYIADRYCGFHFTVSALRDLVVLNKKSNDGDWLDSFDPSLPTLFVSGAEDPVGGYGEGVKKVYDALTERGCNVGMKLYDSCRHEILDETCRAEVIEDILEFIGK